LSAELHLRLYIAGDTLQTRLTIENVKRICSTFPKGDCKVDVIDIKKDPRIAIRDQIFAIPTLVKLSPDSTQQYIGNLSSTDKLIKYLKLD
jgi:circadian clock protein KaiB